MPVPAVLVPLDGSSYAEHAVQYALCIARRTGSTLHLVRVRPRRSIAQEIESRPFTDPGPPGVERRYLDEVAAQIGDVLPVVVKVLHGDPAEAIAIRAAEVSARVIVMCTHARRGAGRALLGSVADGVVRTAAVPVMLIKPPRSRVNLHSERACRRILVPIDGSPQSEQIVTLALDVLGATDAQFTLMRVVHPEAALVPAATAQGDGRSQDPESGLEKLSHVVEARGARADVRLVVDEDASVAILEEAQRSGARLIAMTTRARRGAPRYVIGSVADAVLAGAACPVLLFRPWS